MLLKRSDSLLGLGATAGLCIVCARGLAATVVACASGERDTASLAARWEGDVDRSICVCVGTVRFGLLAKSNVRISFRPLPGVLMELPAGEEGAADGLGAFRVS